ncbi:MFS transporter [Alteromonas sp. D210916BOD_24]|uniref:MFS transporter n=1 Tax=Alteromonas sp. D210916BOD_24 TaxID=3157618 RepID=UPI00399C656B
MDSNKKRLVAGLSLNKLADLLISAKTTLPALLVLLSAPSWMVGWLVPIRESGALLPQAVLSFYLRRHSARHVVWRVGMVVQIASALVMLLSVVLWDGVVAGAVILLALGLLSLGRSACSLTAKDIQADITKKGERGHLIGIASTLSGVVTVAIALPLIMLSDTFNMPMLMGILALSTMAFFATLMCMLPLRTHVDTGYTQADLFSVNFDSTVYKFIVVRGLYVHSALVAPYFMLQNEDNVGNLLPIYIGAEALATLLSSLIWGKLADKSARLTLQVAGILALLACVGLLLTQGNTLSISAGLFFMLSIAHAGVRTGRKTYSLDVKEGHERTELVGFSNTSIGLILLAFGALYAALTPMLSFSVVYIMAGFLVVAIVSTVLLPKEK